MKNLKNAKKVSNTNGLPFPKSVPKVPQKHPKNNTFGDFHRFWGLFGRKSGRFWEKEVKETRTDDELEYSDFFSEDVDWEAVMLNLTLSGLEEDLKAMNLVCVCNGEIAYEK